MAHFAQLNENNVVIQVIVVDNLILINEDGIEIEELGIKFCHNLFGSQTNWIQTSYNGTFRFNYAGIGYLYDSEKDAFIPPKPFASWVLEESICQWVAPSGRPDDGYWVWDENSLSWIKPQTI
jgi:hypothetical protein